MDVHRIRGHFDFVAAGRVVTNNAASTQPPRELIDLYARLTPWYENVHRGQSTASRRTTAAFESSYDTFATWLNAPSRRTIATYRNTTEALNAVMYTLMTDFRDGDNVVTTALEHHSNFVPWYALCREILPRFVDRRTKLVCCTGASNFFGGRPDLAAIRRIVDASGYPQPGGECRSLLLVDGAQLVAGAAVDVRPLRLLVDLAGTDRQRYFDTSAALPRSAVTTTMGRVAAHTRALTAQGLRCLAAIDGLTVYGPASARDRTPLLAFNADGVSLFAIAETFDRHGVEARAGCHCATLAHRALGLDPPASCRLSFALYNTPDSRPRGRRGRASRQEAQVALGVEPATVRSPWPDRGGQYDGPGQPRF